MSCISVIYSNRWLCGFFQLSNELESFEINNYYNSIQKQKKINWQKITLIDKNFLFSFERFEQFVLVEKFYFHCRKLLWDESFCVINSLNWFHFQNKIHVNELVLTIDKIYLLKAAIKFGIFLMGSWARWMIATDGFIILWLH